MCRPYPRGSRRCTPNYSLEYGIKTSTVGPGVGRNAALWFSELGYTVFALCPNRQEEESGPHLTSGRSRQVASVRSAFFFLAVAYPLSEPRSSKASLHLAQQEGEVTIDPMGYGGANATQSLVSIPTRSSTRDRPCPLY